MCRRDLNNVPGGTRKPSSHMTRCNAYEEALAHMKHYYDHCYPRFVVLHLSGDTNITLMDSNRVYDINLYFTLHERSFDSTRLYDSGSSSV